MSTRRRLEADLVDAMRRHEGSEVATIRMLIAALDNAAAVKMPRNSSPRIGFGHDVPRLDLSDDDVNRVIETEYRDLEAAAIEYRTLGQDTHAEELQRRVRIVGRYLGR